jgi:hypothetical protein
MGLPVRAASKKVKHWDHMVFQSVFRVEDKREYFFF